MQAFIDSESRKASPVSSTNSFWSPWRIFSYTDRRVAIYVFTGTIHLGIRRPHSYVWPLAMRGTSFCKSTRVPSAEPLSVKLKAVHQKPSGIEQRRLMVYLPGKPTTSVARVNLVLRELGYVFGHIHARLSRVYQRLFTCGTYKLLLWISVLDGHPRNACRLARVR